MDDDSLPTANPNNEGQPPKPNEKTGKERSKNPQKKVIAANKYKGSKSEPSLTVTGLLVIIIEALAFVFWQLADSLHGFTCGIVHSLSLCCVIAGLAIAVNKAIKRTKTVWIVSVIVMAIIAFVEIKSNQLIPEVQAIKALTPEQPATKRDIRDLLQKIHPQILEYVDSGAPKVAVLIGKSHVDALKELAKRPDFTKYLFVFDTGTRVSNSRDNLFADFPLLDVSEYLDMSGIFLFPMESLAASMTNDVESTTNVGRTITPEQMASFIHMTEMAPKGVVRVAFLSASKDAELYADKLAAMIQGAGYETTLGYTMTGAMFPGQLIIIKSASSVPRQAGPLQTALAHIGIKIPGTIDKALKTNEVCIMVGTTP